MGERRDGLVFFLGVVFIVTTFLAITGKMDAINYGFCSIMALPVVGERIWIAYKDYKKKKKDKE